MFNVQLSINGQSCPSSSGATFERLNPLDRSVATTGASASTEDAVRAVEAAAAAFVTWRETTPGERRALLLKAAEVIEARRDDFLAAMAAETGASAQWAGFNVHLSASMFQEAAGLVTQASGEVIPSDVPGSLALGVRMPAGVVLSIAPWNAPVILAVRALATPLACGNTVILKGSEYCPRTHQLIVDCLIEAGFPNGTVNFLTNAPADAGLVVEAVVAHPAVRRVNFTGSTRVGKIIALTCAKYLKPSVLELGGKAPVVVLDDADIDAAVAATVFASFANSGQVCMAAERIILDNKIADEFARKFVDRAQSLPLADPRVGPAVLGSLADPAILARCHALIDDAVAKGAKLLCGGKSDSLLMPATVLDHVTSDMEIFYEESFGPLKGLVRVDGVEAAIACANDSELGLSAAVFGRDIARAWEVAKRIESGMCHINGPSLHDEAQMPFGGVKGSGWGRFNGMAGVREFTELRWLTVQTRLRHYPF